MDKSGTRSPAPPLCLAAPNPASLTRAGQHIRDGLLVAFPTETVYGLGADATNGSAVARIFEAKGRPRFNPLIVHVPDLAHAERLGVFSAMARSLATAFWPGPLTLVVPRRADAGISELATAGLETIALRCPAHPVARALLQAAERPLAAPSANRSGHVSPTLAQHVAADLGDRAAMILDGGAAAHGLESTVVDTSHADGRITLLRPGAVPVEDIARVTGMPVPRAAEVKDRPQSPGQLASHYAPAARVRLNAAHAGEGEALLAFGRAAPSKGMIINLSPNGDLVEAASALFASLRALDAAGAHAIAVMPIPTHGLGAAINDRLQRAAAPRA